MMDKERLELARYYAFSFQLLDDLMDTYEDMIEDTTVTLPIVYLRVGYLDPILQAILAVEPQSCSRYHWIYDVIRIFAVMLCANMKFSACYFSAPLHADLMEFTYPDIDIYARDMIAFLGKIVDRLLDDKII